MSWVNLRCLTKREESEKAASCVVPTMLQSRKEDGDF